MTISATSSSFFPEGSFEVTLFVSGPVDDVTGWVVDFGEIKAIAGPILDELDHRCLDEMPGLSNSTSETLCKYLWDQIAPKLRGLSAITVWETDTARCTYRGRD